MGQITEEMFGYAGYLYQDTKEKLYKKVMKSKYENDGEKFKQIQETEEFKTDNPNLVAKLKAHDGFEPLLMNAATVLGKYMQHEMKEKNKDKPTNKMLEKAVLMGKRYGEGYCDTEAFFRGLSATVKTLLNTWEHGKDLAKAMGIDDKTFTEMRKNVNANYLDKAPESSKDNKIER